MYIVSVGEDPASKVYVRNKLKTAEEIGIQAIHLQVEPDEDTLGSTLKTLAISNTCGGIILQLPLPAPLNRQEERFLEMIPKEKDIDGLTRANRAGVYLGDEDAIIPATAAAVLDLLPEDMSELSVALMGRGKLCNYPLIDPLLRRNATVHVSHSKTNAWETPDMLEEEFDYYITAIGRTRHWTIRAPYATVIDIGINRDKEGKLCGDLDEKISDVARYTPVPGGVGILTTAAVIRNFVKCLTIQYNNDPQRGPRICSECGKKMYSGYCIGDGLEYYCSDECLEKNYTKEEYYEMYANQEAYWTEWD